MLLPNTINQFITDILEIIALFILSHERSTESPPAPCEFQMRLLCNYRSILQLEIYSNQFTLSLLLSAQPGAVVKKVESLRLWLFIKV